MTKPSPEDGAPEFSKFAGRVLADPEARAAYEKAQKRDRPFWCRIGFHSLFHDSVGENVGSEKTPIYLMTTYLACNKCGYRRRA